MEQRDIQSTEALIKALNEAQDSADKQALQRWIEAYIEWFNSQPVGNFTLKPATVQEYSALAHIQPSIPAHRRLLNGYFDSVWHKARKSEYDSEALLQALAYTLQYIAPQVFHGNPNRLVQLSNDLLEKLAPERHLCSRETYPTYRPILYALHQALVLIHQIIPGSLSTTQENGLYQRFKKQLEAIADAAQYYPFVYHSLVLQQSLQRLASHEPRENLERLGQGLLGALYFTQGIPAFMSLSLDINALRTRCECFQQAREGGRIKKGKWYEQLQAMHCASILSLTETEDSQFYEGLQTIQAAHITDPEERKALRFGILLELSTLALQVDTPAIRQKAFNALEELTSLWADDPDLVEAMLDGFAAIATQGVQREAAQDALEGLINTRVPSKKFLSGYKFLLWRRPTEANPIQVATERWLGGQQLEEKLSALWATGEASSRGRLFKVIDKNLRGPLPRPQPEQPEPIGSTAMPTPSWQNEQQSCFTRDQLFGVINSRVRESAYPGMAVPEAGSPIPPPLTIERTREDLQAHYQQYSHVAPLLGGQPIAVHSVQCQLMVLEKVKAKEKASDQEVAQPAGSSAENQLSQHQERLELVRNPIALEALFNHRSGVAGAPVKAVQRILLTGEAGTGKTTLSRKLAYLWAQGQWGQEFQMVYLLPIWALQQSKYDNLNYRREESLATAIVNNCFAGKQEEAFKQLRQQVSASLEQPNTLVLLDGLDERYGASEGLISQALEGKHKLLILSRPYGIEQEQPQVGLFLEHAGFNALQMEQYIKEHVPSAGEAAALLGFLQEHPAMHQVAHVPVNLEILCALWQDDAAVVGQESKGGSLLGLYRKLTAYIWKRYADSRKAKGLAPVDREDVFSMLGEIALRGLKRGEVLISEETVREVTEEHPSGEALLQESGLLLAAVGRQYQFPHLTFQEYFAGKKLAEGLLSQEEKRSAKAVKLLGAHKYQRQYGVTLSFLAGEISRVQGVAGLRKLLEVLDEGPQEVVGVQHLLLQLQCVDAWLCLQEKGWERDREWTALEEEFRLISALDGWFAQGLEQVRMNGDDALLILLTDALQGMRSVVQGSPATLEQLLQAVGDSYWSVRQAAVSALGKLAAAAPSLAPAILQQLLQAAGDSKLEVRHAVVSALGQLAAAPSLTTLERLLTAAGDSESYVRYAAVSALGQVVGAAPSLATLEQLLQAAGDRNDPFGNVRHVAVSALGQLAAAAPSLATLQPLLTAAGDSESYVCEAAISALRQLAAAAPSLAPDILQPLLTAAGDSKLEVREAAVSALRQLAAAAPSLATLERLFQAAGDSKLEVREAAVSAAREGGRSSPQPGSIHPAAAPSGRGK